jgi:hypothetical protein
MASHRELAADDPKHGTITGYSYGCRLECCTSANREYWIKYRAEHPEYNAAKKKRAADRRRENMAKGLTANGETPLRKAFYHRMRVVANHGALKAEFECIAAVDAPCRLECSEGCMVIGPDHEHVLMQRDSCKIAETLNAAKFSQIHRGYEEIYNGPIAPFAGEAGADAEWQFVLGLEPRQREESA